MLEMSENGTTPTSHTGTLPCALHLPRPHQPARRNWSRHCSKAQWKEKYNCLSHPSGQAGKSTRTNTSKGKSGQVLQMSENETTPTSHADTLPCALCPKTTSASPSQLVSTLLESSVEGEVQLLISSQWSSWTVNTDEYQQRQIPSKARNERKARPRHFARRHIAMCPLSPKTTSASPSQLVSTMLESSVEGEVQLLISSQWSSWKVNADEYQQRQIPSNARNEQKTRPRQLRTQTHYHISQPVAIGLNTARKLSGRRSTIAYLIPVVKRESQHGRIPAKAKPVKCSKCSKTKPRQLHTQAHCHTPFISQDHISQPVAIGLDTARKLGGRRSTIAYLIPVVKRESQRGRIPAKANPVKCNARNEQTTRPRHFARRHIAMRPLSPKTTSASPSQLVSTLLESSVEGEVQLLISSQWSSWQSTRTNTSNGKSCRMLEMSEDHANFAYRHITTSASPSQLVSTLLESSVEGEVQLLISSQWSTKAKSSQMFEMSEKRDHANFAPRHISMRPLSPNTTSASPSQFVSTLLESSVEGEVQLLISSQWSSGKVNTDEYQQRQIRSILEMSENETTPTSHTQAHCHAPFISQDHISQPVAIGLDTARKLSGRRSTIACLIPVVKRESQHGRIPAKAKLVNARNERK